MEVSCHFKELNMRNLEMRVTGNRLCIRYMIALQRTVDGHVIPQGLPSRNSPCSGAAVVRVAGGVRGCQVVAGPGRFRGR